ncbi:MAG: phosphatidylglycerophosphatase A [candidate division Zixibacteria bacterium]|nr:phosphatidylglycerophosphatase A [candidate division Zixibacteria bacterium]
MMKAFLVKAIATGFGFGYLRPFAGTWGTIPGSLLCFLIFPLGLTFQLAFIAVIFILSIWSAGEAEKLFGHDAKKIVIDEILGMAVTMLLVPDPTDWRYYAIGFVLFRVFDVIKLPPARQAESLPGGWGVTVDDFVAGIYANIVLQILARYVLTF